MNALLVDPSLYTAPYDAALTHGLLAAGVRPTWITRPVRAGDREEIPAEHTDAFFYRRVDDARWLPGRLRQAVKGCAHAIGIARLLWKIRRMRPDVVHVQWIVVPMIDLVALAVIRRWCPVIITVHDTVAYNGQKMHRLQEMGLTLPIRLAHRLIVHTRAGRQALARQGVPPERISVIPHGPLSLRVPPAPRAARDLRWTVVLFGEIKPYKGVDVLIEAVASLPEHARRRLRVIVAGRPRMDVAPLLARIAQLGLQASFEVRLKRLTEEEMAQLFAEADAFVFPYRQIDASGVYYLVRSLGKWIIASRAGVFAEEIDERHGALVPPGDSAALARALQQGVAERPVPQGGAAGASWDEIGRATRTLYERARAEFVR